MSLRLRSLLKRIPSDAGEVTMEYVLLAGVAVFVVLGAMEYFFGAISDLFRNLADTIRGVG